jgi:hypothetical protein
VQEGWKIWIADVSTAFLQSDTFKQIAEQTGQAEWHVCLLPPKGTEAEFLKVKGLEHANFNTHALKLLRPAYGLKDAPKLWRRKLDAALVALGCQAVPTDNALHRMYDKQGKLCALLATHVDDIKATATEAATKMILAGLTASFGELKTSFGSFEHCGIRHMTMPDNSIKMCQQHYAMQLKQIPLQGLNIKEIDTKLTAEQLGTFQSILGGLSWLVQTRPDLCIYVVALQRIATRATVGHCLKVNQLVKWARKQPCFLMFVKLRPPLKISCISDAAFRRESAAGLSMRGAVIAISEDRPFGEPTKIHWIAYYSRKQRRVVR